MFELVFIHSHKGLTDRPLTQQGLSGLSTSQGRLGTASGGMRQVKDKRYWIALLQSKIQEIIQETEKLNKEKKNLDRETSAKKLYEKKVKEQAKELSGSRMMHSRYIVSSGFVMLNGFFFFSLINASSSAVDTLRYELGVGQLVNGLDAPAAPKPDGCVSLGSENIFFY